MSTQLRRLLASKFGQLRYEPTAKRIRAELGGRTVVDTTGAALVWEPRRVVPSYAVPRSDIDGDLVPAAADPTGERPWWPDAKSPTWPGPTKTRATTPSRYAIWWRSSTKKST